MNQLNSIRNFSIIAHIDHGKTTLTDRFLEITNTVDRRLMHDRFLDAHPISRERGITIKLAPIRINYNLNNQPYILNLIDTPGHIDFSYEVSRSLACCEGAILLVDSTQGIQAQTLAHFQLAQNLGLKIIPVVNKIDHQLAQPEKTGAELCSAFNFSNQEIIYTSAKTGQNAAKILEAVIEKIPPPGGNPQAPLRALVFNSFYHPFKGIIAYLKIVDGRLDSRKLKLLAANCKFEALEVGYFKAKLEKQPELNCGEVGYVATGLKNISLCRPGDTLIKADVKTPITPLPDYQEPKPMVFFDFYPVENKDFPEFEKAINQLKLNDASLSYAPAGSPALGKGFRLGFLGLFHTLITQERLERDFCLEIIITNPSVKYKISRKDNQSEIIENAGLLPDFSLIKEIKEPWIKAAIFTPVQFIGSVFLLCRESRGKLQNQKYYGSYVNLEFELPLIELLEGFYDRLKSVSSGFASLDYQLLDFRPFQAVKLEVLINKQKVDSLSIIIEKGKAEIRAGKLAKKLKELIPPQLFEVPIQIALNNKIVSRETIKALRKDVTAKLYGGDQTRKDKLLKKQKKGKKRMKQIGRITIPQEAFLAVLKAD